LAFNILLVARTLNKQITVPCIQLIALLRVVHHKVPYSCTNYESRFCVG